MTGFLAAQRHRDLRNRSNFRAASARSTKSEFTQWALSCTSLHEVRGSASRLTGRLGQCRDEKVKYL